MDQLIPKIESYSRAFAEKVSGDHFSQAESVSGEQILKITPIDQVNLFIIKNLFEKWKEESVKLRSPYFDYDKAEVKSAMDQFMAVLSKHISIKKDFFKPLLQKATFDSLCLLLSPVQYFSTEYSNRSSISIIEFKDVKKYYRWGRLVLDEMVSEAEAHNKLQISFIDFIQIIKEKTLNDVFSETGSKSILQEFDKVLPFEISVPAKENVVIGNTYKTERNEVNTTLPQEKTEKEKENDNKKILNEKFAGNQLTLNDILKSEEALTLAEKIGKSKVQNIREVISLNQKFMFITSFFNGERTEYENALNQIERCSSYEEAFQYLEASYASKYHWENGKPELLELKELIYRKFS